jgi:hypothetical protein
MRMNVIESGSMAFEDRLCTQRPSGRNDANRTNWVVASLVHSQRYPTFEAATVRMSATRLRASSESRRHSNVRKSRLASIEHPAASELNRPLE